MPAPPEVAGRRRNGCRLLTSLAVSLLFLCERVIDARPLASHQSAPSQTTEALITVNRLADCGISGVNHTAGYAPILT